MAVTISPSSLPDAEANADYSETLTAAGGTAPYTYAVTDGDLPDGLALSDGGVISGSATVAGVFAFTVTATDSTADTALTGDQAYSIDVTVSDVMPVQCPSYMCAKVPPVWMIELGGDLYLCPRCEQQSVVSGGTATLAPGYHD